VLLVLLLILKYFTGMLVMNLVELAQGGNDSFKLVNYLVVYEEQLTNYTISCR
jgi:hypothetical protein